VSNYPKFPQHELDCPCGCDGRMDDEFMTEIAVPMRLDLGFVFVIPRGGAYRCEEYDGKYGAHQGFAIDTLCNSKKRFKIVEWLFYRNFRIDNGEIKGRKVTRIGINNGSIHFDFLQEDSGKATEVMWDYYG